ncbi:MAG TPA: hypothetical protein VGO22_12000 [Pseudorhizobium sp.]|nr:hypothetical protein [Pseudorhizobium sp.]
MRSFYARCFLYMSTALWSCFAAAQERVINGSSVEIAGVTIAKSGSMQLAELGDARLAPTQQAIYVPAGTPLLLLKHEARDSKRRKLTLAITATGLPVYARADGTHYFSADGIARLVEEKKSIAVAQKDTVVTTATYGDVYVTPSEIYAFRYTEDGQIEILVGKDKIGAERYKGDEYTKIDSDAVAIIDADQLEEKQIADPFQEYDPVEELVDLLKDAAVADLDEAKRREFIRVLQSGRLVSRKECSEEITMSPEVQAGVSFDTDVLFSPIKAKLGISGSYRQTTTLPRGIKFTVKRYARGEKVVEVKQEQIFEEGNCLKSIDGQRLIIAEPDGNEALIDSRKPFGSIRVGANFLPEYSCRSEYQDLLDYFVRQETLEQDSAVLAIAQFARFKSPQNAATCPK